MRPLALLVALLALGSACLADRTAGAFCLARSCDPSDADQDCTVDRDGCVETGKILRWPTSCVTFSVQRDGSPRSDIDSDAVTDMSVRAFQAWLRADCGGEHPSIAAGLLGPVACNESRYDPDAKNANIIMFRDDEWPYPGSADTYGLTVVHFDPASGAILDADIEVNGADFTITTAGLDEGVDLQSILTHELGHFLGLGHSRRDDATMSATWDGKGLHLRTLTSDDEAGICELYQPERVASASCMPRNGFASECNVPRDQPPEASCAMASPARKHDAPLPAGGALIFALLLGARRSARADSHAGLRTTGDRRALHRRRRLGMIERWLAGG